MTELRNEDTHRSRTESPPSVHTLLLLRGELGLDDHRLVRNWRVDGSWLSTALRVQILLGLALAARVVEVLDERAVTAHALEGGCVTMLSDASARTISTMTTYYP
jgi:hypothetical protein